MKGLPEFDTSKHPDMVRGFAERVMMRGDTPYLHDLYAYGDGHFRIIFDPDYFILQDDRTEPSRSQWNTLKKRMKRMNRNVFVFKDHGVQDDGFYWIEFGFFLEKEER